MPGAVPTRRKAPSPSGKRRKYISDDYKNDRPERPSGFPDRVPHRGFLENKSNENFSTGQPFRPNPKAKRGSKRDKHRRNAEPFRPEKCAPGKDASARHCTQENRPQPDRAAEPRRTFETASADTPPFRPRRPPSKRVPNALPAEGLTADRSRTPLCPPRRKRPHLPPQQHRPQNEEDEAPAAALFPRNRGIVAGCRNRSPTGHRTAALPTRRCGRPRKLDPVGPSKPPPSTCRHSDLGARLRSGLRVSGPQREAGQDGCSAARFGEKLSLHREAAGNGGLRLFFRRISLHMSRRIG